MNEKELKELLENLLKKGECEYIEFKKNYNFDEKVIIYVRNRKRKK